jgi:hypothetical protein
LTVDAGGLVEALVAIHKPGKCWGLGAKMDTCRCCSETWPCETLRLVCDAIGQEYPPQQMTGCDGMVRVSEPDDELESGGWRMCHLDRGHDGDCDDGEGFTGPFVHARDIF